MIYVDTMARNVSLNDSLKHWMFKDELKYEKIKDILRITKLLLSNSWNLV